MKKKEIIPYVLAFIALGIGAFYDYAITDALYMRLPLLGLVFERFALIPIQLLVVFTLLLLWQRKGNALFLLLSYVLSLYIIRDSLHDWMKLDSTQGMLITLGLALAIVFLMALIIIRIPKTWIDEHLMFFIFCTCVIVSAVLITSVWKMAWGRVRYREMEDASRFCVWYMPCAAFGHNSFPSGHTTAFTALLCFLQWKGNPYERPSFLRYCIITLLVLLMPITRMIMGAHFLSDTAMGFLITYSCYLYYRTYFQKRGYLGWK